MGPYGNLDTSSFQEITNNSLNYTLLTSISSPYLQTLLRSYAHSIRRLLETQYMIKNNDSSLLEIK